ncbi:MAG: 16S rRNA processing protein RimM [Ruminococcaceae bacterium]|nr:16S rRNA processing protein RimM [Oscillospiraceae bacterium]
MQKLYLECGKIINTHGVAGAVKLESWCDTPSVLAGLKTLYFKRGEDFFAVGVVRASVFKRFVIATLDGVDDIDKANALREAVVYAAREDLPIKKGRHFIADLIGLPIIDVKTAVTYGVLGDVINTGASDIYVINTEGGERMMPAVPEFVKEIDLERGIFVSPIEGMF